MPPLAIHTLALLVAATVAAAAQSPSNIRLQKIDGRTWLIDPAGRPFFAHGVTHIAYGHNNEDVTAIGRACKELGFNACGYGCPAELKAELPYVEDRNDFVPISIYRARGPSFRYVDIFDPVEQGRIEKEVQKLCMSNRNNPHLIGYFWTDLAAWPLKNQSGTNWVEFVRGLPADSPGQLAYRKFLKTWQGEEPSERDLAFLKIIAREYFRVCGEANRKYDPHHLVFGDRYLFQTIVPEVLEESLPYVDAIAIQPNYNPGFPKKDFDRIHELTGKPIIICDFAIPFQEEGKKVLGWKLVENPKIAGERYSEYMKEAFATSYIIGAFWCNPVTQLKPAFYPPGFVKQGLFEEGLKPRPELNQAMRELNQFLNDKTPKR
jgi:hypothetical protein